MRIAKTWVLVHIFFASFAMFLRAQAIQIELVNGVTGQPITDTYKLHVWVGKIRGSGTLTIPTDSHGVAVLRLTQHDSETNIPNCELESIESQKLANEEPKASRREWAEFDKKYENCFGLEIKNPIAKYADTIMINTFPGDVSWKVGNFGHMAYIPCWINMAENNHPWLSATDFSTAEILQNGIVTANYCGNSTAQSQPGHLVLFVRLPTNREAWRQAWN